MHRNYFLAVCSVLVLAPWALADVGVPTTSPAPSAATPAQRPAGHYIQADAIDLKALLPNPPADDSPATHAEIGALLRLQASRTPEQVARAQSEVKLTALAFATVLGPDFTKEQLPVTSAFLKRVASDAKAVSANGKLLWQRPRPFELDPRIQPALDKPATPSYPSGHATEAYTLAIVLGQLFPQQKEALLQRAQQIGQDRMIGGVHYPSDIEAGTKLGNAIAQKLLASPAFQHDLQAARREVDSVMNGSPHTQAGDAPGMTDRATSPAALVLQDSELSVQLPIVI